MRRRALFVVVVALGLTSSERSGLGPATLWPASPFRSRMLMLEWSLAGSTFAAASPTRSAGAPAPLRHSHVTHPR